MAFYEAARSAHNSGKSVKHFSIKLCKLLMSWIQFGLAKG